MKTIIQKSSVNSISLAANIIRDGGLVAFPTETVFGLGANAYNQTAIQNVYSVKGRPSDNPLIAHVSDLTMLQSIVKCVNEQTYGLIEKFWPGPLTIVFNSNKSIGIMDTIAVRMPANKTAREMISQSGVPVFAPSANLSGTPSSTAARHVIDDLDGKIEMIIYDNEQSFGLESTVIDMTTEIPIVLRPGAITCSMLSSVLEYVEVASNFISVNDIPKAPGMKYKHYAPSADVFIVLDDYVNKINKMILSSDKKIGVMATEQSKALYDSHALVISVGDRNDLLSVAANLFSTLRLFDVYKVDEIYAEGFLENEIGFAIMNRLLKAAEFKVI